jgi:hypothetical protein
MPKHVDELAGPMGENPVLDVVRAARLMRRELGGLAGEKGEIGAAWWALDTALQDFDRVEHAYHVVHLRERDFVIMHPLTCRPNLFDCDSNDWVRAEGPFDDLEPGHYQLIDAGDGNWEIGPSAPKTLGFDYGGDESE